MTRLPLRVLSTVAITSLAVSACGGDNVSSRDVAASVRANELTFDAIDGALGELSMNGQAVRDLTSRFVIAESLRADLEALGVDVVPMDLGDDPLASVDEAMNANAQAWQSVPADRLADDATRAAYESGNSQVVCLNHLLTDTEEEALDALERIEAGEAFPDVAAEVSTDTGSAVNGGFLGCLPAPQVATTFVPEFAEAATDLRFGEVAGPVETQFGFHLLTQSDFENLSQTDLLRVRLSQFEEQYDIIVDPRVGQWTDFGEVVPLG